RRAVAPPGASAAPRPADEAYTRAAPAADRGERDEARRELEDALRLDANHGEAHRLLGFVLGQQRDLGQALSHLERAVVLRPDSPEAHYSLGVALFYSGSRERALAELRKSMALDPA